MKQIQRTIYLMSLCLLGTLGAFAQSVPQNAQDVKNIVNDRKLKISGGINASQVFYGVSSIESRRNPYAYFVSGNINFSMFQLNVPLNFTFTNQVFNYNYQLPSFDFNQFGIQPSWKWIKLYAGYNTMSFSPYTLNGALFLGGGVELTPPGPLKVEAMYGRLRKAQPYNPSDSSSQQAPFGYERRGYGAKLTYSFKNSGRKKKKRSQITSKYNRDGGLRPPKKDEEYTTSSFFKEGDQVSLIVFGAHDLANSVVPPPDSLNLPNTQPESNLVMSVQLHKSLGKRITLDGEIAGSAVNQDTRITTSDDETQNVFNLTDGVFKRNTSTAYYSAYRGNLNYNADFFIIGVGYEWVDPEYRTLGAYYFNNDLENITVNFSTQLFKNKLSLATNVGTQRNNLNNNQLATLRRLSTAVNVNFMPNQAMNFNLTYSNFQSLTRIRSQFELINQVDPLANIGDSLNLTQISQNANLNANFVLLNTQRQQQNLNVNVAYQQADNRQQGSPIPGGSRFYQVTTAYNVVWTLIDFNAALAFNYNQNTVENLDNRMLGPTLTLTKGLFKKKVSLILSSSFNQAYNNTVLASQVLNGRFGINYTYQQKHQLSFNAIYLNQRTLATEGQTPQPAFSEFTGTLNYSYNF